MSVIREPFSQLFCGETRFTKSLQRASQEESYRVVVMVGAGLSAPSGIPTAGELSRYLAYCVWKALSLWLAEQTPWDPRLDKWPSVSEVPMGFDAQAALARDNKATAKKLPSELLRIFQLASGAVADWLSALHFLTRLTFEHVHESGQNRKIPVLTAPEDAVIDQFFGQLVANRKPSLGHRVLVELARQLRIDLVLTTNFDHLIEEAFEEAGTKIETFEVHRETGLPPASLVTRQRSLVKLHGGRYGLRADTSLDAIPPQPDLETFANFLSRGAEGHQGPASQPDENSLARPSSTEDLVTLLVAGVSGTDRRTLRLLEHALKHVRGLRIHWVYYSSDDRKHLMALLGREPWKALASGKTQRLWFTQHTDLGLLFLRLYQECVRALPPSGIIYPVPWNMPYPPMFPDLERKGKPARAASDNDDGLNRLTVQISEQISEAFSALDWIATHPHLSRPVAVHIHNGHQKFFGAATACARLFRSNPWAAGRVWLDLDETQEPADVFLMLSLAMKRLSGNPNPVSGINLCDFYQPSIRAFVQTFVSEVQGHSTRKWVVFLNGRQQPGKNSLVPPLPKASGDEETSSGLGNSNLDVPDQRSWEYPINRTRFWDVLQQVSEALARGVVPQHVVFVVISSAGNLGVSRANTTLNVAVDENYVAFNPQDACLAAEKWGYAPDRKSRNPPEQVRRAKLCLLYILTRFHLTRYSVTIREIFSRWLSQGPEPDGRSKERPEAKGPQCPSPDGMLARYSTWVEELEQLRVLRFKPGGFLWMDVDVRRLLRIFLRREVRRVREQPDGRRRAATCRRDLMIVNAHVARSFGRLLLATGDPLAAFECVYHVMEVLGRPPLRDRKRASPGDLAQRVEFVLHATLVFRTAAGDIARRVTEQFSHNLLRALRGRVGRSLRRATAQGDRELQRALADLFAAIVGAELSAYEAMEQHTRILELHERAWRLPELAATNLKLTRQSVRDALRLSAVAACIGQRSYEMARRYLEKFWEEPGRKKCLPPRLGRVIWGDSGATPPIPDWQPEDLACLWTRHHCLRLSVAARRCIVKGLRRMAYLYIHVAYAEYLGSYGREKTSKRPRAQKALHQNRSQIVLKWAELYCRFALGMLRGLVPEEDDFVFRENARLRAHLALIKARLARQGLRGSASRSKRLLAEAEVHLVDAEAFVSKFPVHADKLSQAVIELRRAEVILIEIATVGSIRKLRRRIRSGLGSDFKSAPGDAVPVDKVPGRLHDAARALRRAEHFLQNYPNNIWWREILVILKLKCYEYACAVDLLRADSVKVPDLICRDALFHELALDERANLHCLRRDDVFHLARACDSIARTYWTMLCLAGAQPDDPWRLRETQGLRACLGLVRRQLEEAVLRLGVEEGDEWTDPRIKRFATRTLEDIKAFELWTSPIIGG